MAYTEQVIKNFLFHKVRVKQHGWWIFRLMSFNIVKMVIGTMYSHQKHNKLLTYVLPAMLAPRDSAKRRPLAWRYEY